MLKQNPCGTADRCAHGSRYRPLLEALAQHVLRKQYWTEDAESCLRPAEEGSADRRQLKDIAEHAEVLRRFHLEVLPKMREAAKRVSRRAASLCTSRPAANASRPAMGGVGSRPAAQAAAARTQVSTVEQTSQPAAIPPPAEGSPLGFRLSRGDRLDFSLSDYS